VSFTSTVEFQGTFLLKVFQNAWAKRFRHRSLTVAARIRQHNRGRTQIRVVEAAVRGQRPIRSTGTTPRLNPAT
jgi:hypothetical protein